jgi:metal-sulfur cluster biosynthetic enzyme
MTTPDAVLGALTGVRDPELDESLPALGFVAGIEVADDAVAVSLRLPTYWCAPNFAYLMVADARRALLALDGVREAHVTLADHFSAEEITTAVDHGGELEDAFPGESDGSLEEVRGIFLRKAFVARQGRVCDQLVRGGATHAALAMMRVIDLPATAEAARVIALRGELGLTAAPSDAAFVRPNGAPLTAAELPRWLRVARLVRLSLEANGGLCRSLLRTRYGLPDPEEEETTR